MEHLTLSQLQKKIRFTLEENLHDCWVAAEINELSVNNSGHCYMTLVEKGGDNHIPKARINAVIWRSSFSLLNGFFKETTGMPISEGMKVLVYVSVTYHELYGISLQIKDIDPTYTLGDMERQRQECIAQLKADGIYDMNRELEHSLVIENIAVISSDKAAGYQDFINELAGNEYGYRFNTTLYKSFMQGAEAEDSIINALSQIAEEAERYDAVVMIRGGGSQSDLGCFNSYVLCSYIAQFPLPIITGIGHNKDVSVADMVAHDSIKTPTAVARFIIDKALAFEQRLDTYAAFMADSVNTTLRDAKNYLDNAAQQLRYLTSEKIHGAELLISRYGSELRLLADNRVISSEHKIKNLSDTLRERAHSLINGRLEGLSSTEIRLKLAAENRIVTAKNRLELLESSVKGADPYRILGMGYSITRVNGKAVKNVDDVNDGDRLDIFVANGVIKGTVTGKQKNN